mmetsp:Transcript_97973/g.272651  ORF Transcript_97973/g.272651 Transcript_97973/m.272651 type:complete len:263 (-) Transcript_97973:172-960(-)
MVTWRCWANNMFADVPVARGHKDVINTSCHRALASNLKPIVQEPTHTIIVVVSIHVAVAVCGNDRGGVTGTKFFAFLKYSLRRGSVPQTTRSPPAWAIKTPMRAEDPKSSASMQQLGVAHVPVRVIVSRVVAKVLMATHTTKADHARLVEDAIEGVCIGGFRHAIAQSTLQLVLIHALLKAGHISTHLVHHDIGQVLSCSRTAPATIEVRVKDIPAEDCQRLHYVHSPLIFLKLKSNWFHGHFLLYHSWAVGLIDCWTRCGR